MAVVEGNAKPTPRNRACRDNCGVDPDHVAAQADQRPTRITWIDRRICLQDRWKLVPDTAQSFALMIPPSPWPATKWLPMAHPVSYLHAIRVSQARRRQVFACINFSAGQVRVFVNAHHFSRCSGGLVVQLTWNLGRLVHYVIVREDVAALSTITRNPAAFSLCRTVLSAHQRTCQRSPASDSA